VVEDVRPAQLVDALEVLLDRLRHVVEEQHLVERPDRSALRARAIVEDEQEQGVVELSDLLQEADHPSELVIGVADEPGEHLHHPHVHLVKDENGEIKEHKLGRRAGKKGMGIGVALGVVAAIPTGGLSLAVVLSEAPQRVGSSASSFTRASR
jgi:hypothetical protein